MINEFLDLAFFNGSAWKGHGKFAIKLVETLKPKVTVELGVDLGYSSFCFAYPKIGNVYGVDWFKGDIFMGNREPEIVKKSLFELYDRINEKYKINNLEFIESEFNDLAKKWDKKIDILHIDGCHDYNSVKNDYDTWSKFCHPESVILLHDIFSFRADVGRLFNEIEGYKLERPNWSGLGILTQSEKIHKTISGFVNENIDE